MGNRPLLPSQIVNEIKSHSHTPSQQAQQPEEKKSKNKNDANAVISKQIKMVTDLTWTYHHAPPTFNMITSLFS